ncbi:MAG: hypothetical protein DMF27_12150 [Verrucomicrobia bacterium]|nr:MAG: hypothetical protein DMF27_12150 [Verrucomicrobiota bacterium]
MAEDSREQIWPSLDYSAWRETCATLQLWTQIAGKIRLALGPWINHSWGVTLYVTARGLTTSLIPYGTRAFEIEFDFIRHQMRITTAEGDERAIKLQPQSVASFYREVMSKLRELAIEVQIGMRPNETLEAIPFDRDEKHAAYDPEYADRFWRVLLQADRVFKEFRSGFCGKCSPVHFFWGSFDLAVTRFSGRRAPPHPGGIPHLPDAITREAYSQEVSSLGFWLGNDQIPTALFYSYAYPSPDGFADAKIKPAAASFHPQLREFVLPYEDARRGQSPDDMILEFAQSTYDAASTLAKWDRAAFEEKKPALHSARQHS